MKFFINKNGQSLLEALVALAVLVTGFLGMITLFSRSFFLDRVVSDQTKATYLAEEGIELTKNLIDHDVYLGLATAGAQGGWGACFNFAAGTNDYELDYTTVNCPAGPNYTGLPLKFDPATGLYSYTGPVTTNFARRIRITKPAGQPDEIDVQSIVTWSTGPVTSQSLTLEDHFYNWHP